MRYRWLLQIGMLAVAIALGTLVMGWWTVPALGVIWGLIARERERPQVVVATAAAIGWALLILWMSAQGPTGAVARRVAGVLDVPPVTFFAMTVAYPTIVAWAAAVIATTLRSKSS